MRQLFFKCIAIGAAFFMPALAQAAEGFATANVNMRAGPSTNFPVITVIPDGRSVEIHGCLSDRPWCDVSFFGNRGWVSGHYVQASYRSRRVRVEPDYYRSLGIPSVVFSIGTYWNNHYRNRSFYRDRDRWSRGERGHYERKPDVRPHRPDVRPHDWNKPTARPFNRNNKPPRVVSPRLERGQPTAGTRRLDARNNKPDIERKRPTDRNLRPNVERKRPIDRNSRAAPTHNRPKAGQNRPSGQKPGVKRRIECRPGDPRCKQ